MTGPATGPGARSGTGPAVDVLIPAFERPGALVATLATLVAQTLPRFRVVVSDQTEQPPLPIEQPEVVSLARILRATGRSTELVRHVPRRGMAEHRQSLLDRARAPFALFLDADIALEGDLLARLLAAIERSGAGFVGSAVVGASFIGDVRPHEEAVEFWDGAVVPEEVTPEGPGWDRYRLHNAANLHHVRERTPGDGTGRDRLYKVAWVGGCVMYDVAKLRSVGGFEFWRELPPSHAGEDVLAQLRVMARYGGAGLFPSGAWHLELPTTIADREVDAPRVLSAR